MTMNINGTRLLQLIDRLGNVGSSPGGGVTRLAGTNDDKKGRDMVVDWMRDKELDIQIDRVGNIFGGRGGIHNNLEPIMVGSHIDSVINGGRLDGALGVAINE